MAEKFYKLGLIGYPLGHSLSPILYKTALEEFGLNGSYELLPTESVDLVDRIKYLRKNGFYGFNITIPHKIVTTLFLAKYDEFLNLTGAVNTIKIEKDLSLTGYNTDVIGFMEPLKEYDLKDKKAVVLGTGGASRAICAGLNKLGIKKIDIYTRNIVNSIPTMNVLRNSFGNIEFNAIQYSLMNTFEDVDIVVNATPVGMKNFDEDNSPVEDKQIESLPKDAIVYDIVYNPLKTNLIAKAIRYKKNYITGLDMLTHQAVAAFEIWTGKKPNWQNMKLKAMDEYYLK